MEPTIVVTLNIVLYNLDPKDDIQFIRHHHNQKIDSRDVQSLLVEVTTNA